MYIRTFNIYFLSNVSVYNIVLLIIATMLYFRSLDIFLLILGGVYLLTKTPHFPLNGIHQFTLCFNDFNFFILYIKVRLYNNCLPQADPLPSHCIYSPWVIPCEPVALIIIYMPRNVTFICSAQIFLLHPRTTLLLLT